MKVSELIELLQQALNEEGDIELRFYNPEMSGYSPIESTEVTDDGTFLLFSDC